MNLYAEDDHGLFDFRPAPQHEYKDVDDFRKNRGNFDGHFVDLPGVHNTARERPAWKRFEAKHPDIAKSLTQRISPIIKQVGDELLKNG